MFIIFCIASWEISWWWPIYLFGICGTLTQDLWDTVLGFRGYGCRKQRKIENIHTPKHKVYAVHPPLFLLYYVDENARYIGDAICYYIKIWLHISTKLPNRSYKKLAPHSITIYFMYDVYRLFGISTHEHKLEMNFYLVLAFSAYFVRKKLVVSSIKDGVAV